MLRTRRPHTLGLATYIYEPRQTAQSEVIAHHVRALRSPQPPSTTDNQATKDTFPIRRRLWHITALEERVVRSDFGSRFPTEAGFVKLKNEPKVNAIKLGKCGNDGEKPMYNITNLNSGTRPHRSPIDIRISETTVLQVLRSDLES
jgi:hypothetical protein